MRTIFAIIALFSLVTLRAQDYVPSTGGELPRGEVLPYPSQQSASAADGNNNTYFTRLTEWTREGNVFSTPFTVPFAWSNRQVLIHLDSASADYEVRVNGRTVAYNGNGNQPADFNVTRQAKEGRNTLEIVVKSPSANAPLESWKEAPVPAIGTAWVMSQPTLRVRDVQTRTWRSDEDTPADVAALDSAARASRSVTAEVGLIVKSSALNPRTSRIYYELFTPSGRRAAVGHQDMTLDMRKEDTLRFLARIPYDSLWSPEKPLRYSLQVKTQREGRYEEYQEYRIGFRSVEMESGRMMVNGQPVSLYVREVSPQITAPEIATLRSQGYNTLKLLPGTVQPSLYETCDTTGIYVIAQAPVDTRRSGESRRKGGNPSNDPAWQGAYIERAQDSYHTSKRHPSVIAFSLAAKSANGICLYESYLAMKKLGETRPFIYPDAGGEWNTDHLEMNFEPGKIE